MSAFGATAAARVAAAVAILGSTVALTPGVAAAACTDGPGPGVSWTGCELPFSDLNDTDLQGADLSGADLQYSVMFRANLAGANLRGANFKDAFPVGANLSSVDATDAVFLDADLVGANLAGAVFRGANLEGADLDFASIAGADFVGADLTGADFFGVTGAAEAVFGLAPQSVDDTVVTVVGRPVVIRPLANDDPAETNPGASTRLAMEVGPTNGTFDPASGVYRPNAGFSGVDSFRYRPIDRIPAVNLPAGAQVEYAGAVATVTIRVVRQVVLAPPFAGASGERGEIVRLYVALLNRSPEQQGFDFWLERYQSGQSLESIAATFLASSEFLGNTGSLSDDAFVTLVYHYVFARDPDPVGREFWVGQLGAGLSRSRLVVQFSNGVEFKTLTGTT